MKVLFLHTDNFSCKPLHNKKSKNLGLPVKTSPIESNQCLICLEDRHKKEKIDMLFGEIQKISKTLGTNQITLFPFAHLSNRILEYSKSKKIYELIKK